MRIFTRSGAMIALVALISGCSMFGSDDPAPAQQSDNVRSAECRINPNSCRWEGSYEDGEREYAEAEARRLNQQQIDKLSAGGTSSKKKAFWDLFF